MSNYQEHSLLHEKQVVQKALSTNDGHTVTEKDRLYTAGHEMTIDSRDRDAARYPNANSFTLNTPRIQKGIIRFEIKNLVLPLGTGVGRKTAEHVAYLRISGHGQQFERGFTTDNFWYTLALPLTNADEAGQVSLKVADGDNRAMYHFIPKHNIGNQLTMSLWVRDVANGTYVGYPFAADAADPAENYLATLEFLAFE